MKDSNMFEFKVANGVAKPAIWFHLNNKDVIVHPYNLYSILCDCNFEEFFCSGIKASFLIFKDEVFGSFQDEDLGTYHIDFQRESFLVSAIDSIKDLCKTVLSGKEIFYKNIEKASAEKLLVGLDDLVIPKNYHQILRDEIDVNNFSFNFVEPYRCDTHYVIKIGQQEFDASLSDWSNNFNSIRMNLEAFVLHMGSDIKLYFEDSPTIIKLSTRNIWGTGYSVTNERLVKVTVIPNDFINEPNIHGWCEPRQLVGALYLGLLGLCIRETNWTEYRDGWTWDRFRLATYNKLQSCVIENYIKGIDEDELTYFPRQRVINSVEEMLEDYKKLQNSLSL